MTLKTMKLIQIWLFFKATLEKPNNKIICILLQVILDLLMFSTICCGYNKHTIIIATYVFSVIALFRRPTFLKLMASSEITKIFMQLSTVRCCCRVFNYLFNISKQSHLQTWIVTTYFLYSFLLYYKIYNFLYGKIRWTLQHSLS